MTPTPTTDSAVSPVSDERLREQGVEVLRRLSTAKVSLSDASFIAGWVTEARHALSRRSLDTADGVEWPEYFASIPAHAKWCQPGDRQDKQHFIVRFDDPDRTDAVFTDEGEARKFYARATLSWNCWLFGALPAHPDASRTPNTEKVVKAEPKGWFDYRGTVERVSAILTEFGMPPEGEVDQFEWLRERLASPPSPAEVTDTLALEALRGLILLKDLFDASDRNQADAYYILAKQDGAWGNARSALASLQLNKKG